MVARSHYRVLIVALVCAYGAPVRAQSSSARELFQQGVSALEEERFEAAVESFLQARELEERPATVCNLALAYDRWGEHELDALEAYVRCAELDRTGARQTAALARVRELGILIRAQERLQSPREPADLTTPENNRAPPEVVAEPPLASPAPPTPRETSSPSDALLVSGAVMVGASAVLWVLGAVVLDTSATGADRLADRYPDREIPRTLEDGSPNPDVALLESLETSNTAGVVSLIAAATLSVSGIVSMILSWVIDE